MESNDKRVELTTREKDGKSKRFEAQNPWKGLRAHETKGRKERPSLPRSEDQKESSGKNWAEILRGCQGLEILGACSTAEIELR